MKATWLYQKNCYYSTTEFNDAEMGKMPDSDHENLLVKENDQ